MITEKDLKNPDFNPGGIYHTPKVTDIQWKDVGSALPPFNWDEGYDVEEKLAARIGIPGFKLPVKDQFQSGSCGGQATATQDASIEAAATKTHEERSAKFVISQTFILSPTGEMLGSQMRDNADLSKKQGVSREIICPSYDSNGTTSDDFMNRPQDVTEAAREDAKVSKAKSYAFIINNIDEFAQALAANWGIQMLLRGENNGTWLTPDPVPPSDGQGAWGHFMFGGKAKMRKGKKSISNLQSWGKNVGEDGWQWFNEDWFASGAIKAGLTMLFDDSIPPPLHYVFTRDLFIGSTGIDVKFLQVFLNTHGYTVAVSGPGSIGNETSNFGPLTQNAVIRFQAKHNISPAKGYFGPLTRAAVNAIP